MDDVSFELPRGGDQLFRSDGNWEHTARLNPFWPEWELLIIGFRDCANLLVQQMIDGQVLKEAQPFTRWSFSFRHYIELRLKDIIQLGNLLKDRAGEIPPTHRLGLLWDTARPFLVKLCREQPAGTLSTAERLIKEFDRYDEGSFSFRYPVDRSGDPVTHPASLLNLRNLRDVMERLATLLDLTSNYAGVLLDAKRRGSEWQVGGEEG